MLSTKREKDKGFFNRVWYPLHINVLYRKFLDKNTKCSKQQKIKHDYHDKNRKLMKKMLKNKLFLSLSLLFYILFI